MPSNSDTPHWTPLSLLVALLTAGVCVILLAICSVCFLLELVSPSQD